MKIRSILFNLILLFSLSAVSFLNLTGQTNTNNSKLDIVFIGNSITQGVQLENAGEEAPPAYATRYLRTLKGVESAQFLNRGRSGYTTVNFLPSADGELSKVILAVKDFHTDQSRLLVFSISLGTNDSAEEGPKGSPVSPSEYRQNMKAITGELLKDFPGCKVVIQQPIWYSPSTYNRSRYLAAGLARLQSYFPELKSLVQDFADTNPGRVYMGDTKAFDYFRENYLTDLIPEAGNAGTFYLHPNKKGAESLGKFWAEGIWQSLFPQRTYSKENLAKASPENLNLYLMKAHKLKKTGGLLSIAGPVTAIAGIGLVSASLNGGSEGMYSLGLGMMLVGTGATIVGLPLLITGSSRVNNVKKAISASLGVASIAPAPFSLHNYKNQNLQPGLRLSIIF